MSTKELAINIINGLSDEQLQAFITLFGSENLQAILEADQIANDENRQRYDSIEDIEKEIFADE